MTYPHVQHVALCMVDERVGEDEVCRVGYNEEEMKRWRAAAATDKPRRGKWYLPLLVKKNMLLLLLLLNGLTLFACVCRDRRETRWLLPSHHHRPAFCLMPLSLPTTHSRQPHRSHTSPTQPLTSPTQRDGAHEGWYSQAEGKHKTTLTSCPSMGLDDALLLVINNNKA